MDGCWSERKKCGEVENGDVIVDMYCSILRGLEVRALL